MVRWLGAMVLGAAEQPPTLLALAQDGTRLLAERSGEVWNVRVAGNDAETSFSTLPARSEVTVTFAAIDSHGHRFIELWSDAEGLHYRPTEHNRRVELSRPDQPLMARAHELREEERELRCSFCNKNRSQVKKLIAGPNVYICDECIALCTEIIAS